MECGLWRRVSGLSRPISRRNCGEHDVPVIARSQMNAAKESEPVGMLKWLGWRNMMSRIVAPIGVAFGDNSSAEAISLAGLIHGRAAQRSQRPSLNVRRA